MKQQYNILISLRASKFNRFSQVIAITPLMKTHVLAGVTLALKSVGIGGYPGLVYGSVRSAVHRKATEFEPTGTATAIIDMVKANKIGLNEIDTFKWAMKAGMTPNKIGDIQILGERPDDVKRQFKKPQMLPYNQIQDWYAPPC